MVFSMARVPCRPLDPEFVRAIRSADQSLVTLAALSGYPSYTQLSVLLNGKRIIGTVRRAAGVSRTARIRPFATFTALFRNRDLWARSRSPQTLTRWTFCESSCARRTRPLG